VGLTTVLSDEVVEGVGDVLLGVPSVVALPPGGTVLAVIGCTVSCWASPEQAASHAVASQTRDVGFRTRA
jgi:hypothetical protein